MKDKNKVSEGLEMDMTTYKKVKGTLDPKTPIKITGDKPAVTSTSPISEEDAVIEPQDKSTIKYLSNVKDPETGKVSKPFTIAGKNYQMVRGVLPSKEIVMGVFCHDDMDEDGNNLIHPVDYFEKNIVNQIEASIEQPVEAPINQPDSDTFEGYRHYFVNRKTNEVRKFKSIVELVQNQKSEDEDYMGVKEFKQHMNEKLFGSRKKSEVLNEVVPTGEESDEEMNIKAKKLMDMIAKKIPANVIQTIKTPVAKREVIAAFAELIGVPRNGLSGLLTGLKDISKNGTDAENVTFGKDGEQDTQQVKESRKITKKQLEETLSPKKVIKTIKIKDIK